jgi:hypothetical protein
MPMLPVVLFIGVCGLIVYGAFRIILGWVLPRSAVVAFDNFLSRAAKLVFQLLVLALAGLIMWSIWASQH